MSSQDQKAITLIWEPPEALLLPQWEAAFQPPRVGRNGGDHAQLDSPSSGSSVLAEGSRAASATSQRRAWCRRPPRSQWIVSPDHPAKQPVYFEDLILFME